MSTPRTAGPTSTAAEAPNPVEGGFGATLRRLSSAQKPPATGSPAYSRFVNRRIGRPLAAAAYVLGLTPNQVTAISATFSLSAVVLTAVGPASVITGVGITLLLVVGYAFDSADGQVARLRGGGSPAGEWLDHVVDSVKAAAVHLAVLIGMYRHDDVDRGWLLVPVGFVLASTVFFFVQILTDQLRRAHPLRAPAPADASVRSILRSVVLLPTDYGAICLVFVLWAWQPGFLAVYGLLLAGTTAFLLAALPRWYGEMVRLTAEPGR